MACTTGVVSQPTFTGQYSVGMSTLDYPYEGGCTVDTHTEYISTPNYNTLVYPTGFTEFYNYVTARLYEFPTSSQTPCATSAIDTSERNEYLGNWLSMGTSVNKGSSVVNGQTVTNWVSDESWLDFDYSLYVTSAGIPVREFGCAQDADIGYYAYVTDFTGYTRGTPAAGNFTRPSSCSLNPTSNPFEIQSTHEDEPAVSRIHRIRRDAYMMMASSTSSSSSSASFTSQFTSSDCNQWSYNIICSTLIDRIAAADSDSSSDSAGAIVGGVIGGIFGLMCCIFCCVACCANNNRSSESTWVQSSTATTDPTPIPMVTFHYDNEAKEEKRPDGPQLFRERMYARDDWRARCAAIDFTYAVHDDGRPYWDETGAYRLTKFAATELEKATRELHARCMDVVARVIASDELLLKFGISPILFPLIRRSWDEQLPSIYGRFDLMYDGRSPPKLLEYNADTPTLLVESGIAQRTWLSDMKARGSLPPSTGQFNELEASLTELWRTTRTDRRVQTGNDCMYFACLNHHNEDQKNMEAMRKHANDAGFITKSIHMEDIIWNGTRFVDRQGLNIDHCWKLYPLEWMAADALPHLASSSTQWIEPAWKLILSSKGILPLLWEMFPGHPNLVAATWDETTARSWGTRYVSKPLQGREGQLTTVHEPNGSPVFQRGVRQDDPDGVHGLGARLVYQQFVAPPSMMGQLPPSVAPVSPLKAGSIGAPGGPSTAPPPYSYDAKAYGAPPPPYETATAPVAAATKEVPLITPVDATANPPSSAPLYADATPVPQSSIDPSGITVTVSPMNTASVVAPPFSRVISNPKFDHPVWPVFGSWVVGGQPAGIVIREDIALITNNESRIIPHFVEGEFKTTPPSEIPMELREQVPAQAGSTSTTVNNNTTVIYSGYRGGYGYCRSTYWYPMSYHQAHYYRVNRPIFRPVIAPPHRFGGFSSGHHHSGGYRAGGFSGGG